MKHLHHCTLIAVLACAGQVAWSGEVKVVGDKCVGVDGKPLFVIGVYSANAEFEFLSYKVLPDRVSDHLAVVAELRLRQVGE